MKSVEYYPDLLDEDYLKTKKERLYLESVAKAQLKAIKRLARRSIKQQALNYMEQRFEERLEEYNRLYGDL